MPQKGKGEKASPLISHLLNIQKEHHRHKVMLFFRRGYFLQMNVFPIAIHEEGGQEDFDAVSREKRKHAQRHGREETHAGERHEPREPAGVDDKASGDHRRNQPFHRMPFSGTNETDRHGHRDVAQNESAARARDDGQAAARHGKDGETRRAQDDVDENRERPVMRSQDCARHHDGHGPERNRHRLDGNDDLRKNGDERREKRRHHVFPDRWIHAHTSDFFHSNLRYYSLCHFDCQ